MWIKVENGVVVQKQPNFQDGFIKVSDDVICGMVQNGADFVAPEPEENISAPSDIEIRLTAIEAKVKITPEDKQAALEQIMSADTVDGQGG